MLRSVARIDRVWRVAAAVSVFMFGAACAGDDDGEPGAPTCVQFEFEGCSPQFPAEFERLHQEMLLPVCGVQGGACHGTSAAAGAQDGLLIDADLDATFDTLMGTDGGPVFVRPGDVACSPLAARANTDEETYLMPPGAVPLDAAVRCSLALWIAEGASR